MNFPYKTCTAGRFASTNAGAGPATLAYRLGFWSAALTVAIAAIHMIIGVLTPPRAGPFAPPADLITYPYTDVAAFIPGDYAWLYPGILLAFAFVVLMVCIHYRAPEHRKIFSQVGLSFALIYATVISVDYFLQFAVVQPSLLNGETASLSLLTQYNPHGIFIALECLGYSVMSIALLFAAGAFTNGKLELAISGIFIAGFVLAAAAFVVLFLLMVDFVAFEVAVLSIDWLVLIIAGTLLCVLFRRISRSTTYEAKRGDRME
jgi:hypothetical protein